MAKDNREIINMQCTKCKNINYHTYKRVKPNSGEKIERLERKKFCRKCFCLLVNKRISKNDYSLSERCFLILNDKLLFILRFAFFFILFCFQKYRIFYRKCLGPRYSVFIDILFFRSTEFSIENVWAPGYSIFIDILFF